MIWGKKSDKEEGEKMSGPQEIPRIAQQHLVTERKMNPELVKFLRAVVRKGPKGKETFDIRVFDEAEAEAKKIHVMDYTSLDERPDLILYDGWFDDVAKQVNLEEKKKVSFDTPLFTEEQIQQKIEALGNPGDTIFFYLARGSKRGGPLGMGAAVVELNPNYPGEKEKKYILYRADVIDMQPVGKGDKIMDSDKPKKIAGWIKELHHQRMYAA